MRNTLEALPVQTLRIPTIEQLEQACARSEPLEIADPYLASVELDLHATFYPLGFPIELSTNSSQVLEAVAESWSGFQKIFAVEPITLTVGVTEGGSPGCPPAPLCRIRQHLYSNVADAENFAVADFEQAFSHIWVTRAALDHRSYFRYFFLESAAMAQICNRYAWGIHAACVELDGAGVLLCGDSGAGKSTLSYACARAGWTFITDDGSYLVNRRHDRLVVGDCGAIRFRPSAESMFPELRGMPAMQRAQAGKPSVDFSTISAPQLITSPTSRIKHVVFLNRNVSCQELVPFPVEVARLYMLQRASSAPELRSRQATMFDRLLEGGAFELRYIDHDWAVDRLAQLVRAGC